MHFFTKTFYKYFHGVRLLEIVFTIRSLKLAFLNHFVRFLGCFCGTVLLHHHLNYLMRHSFPHVFCAQLSTHGFSRFSIICVLFAARDSCSGFLWSQSNFRTWTPLRVWTGLCKPRRPARHQVWWIIFIHCFSSAVRNSSDQSTTMGNTDSPHNWTGGIYYGVSIDHFLSHKIRFVLDKYFAFNLFLKNKT